MKLAPKNEKMFPNRVEEDQDVELQPVFVGPPAYGSPEGDQLGNQLVPLVDDPHHTAAMASERARSESGDYSKMKKAELSKLAEEREIEGASEMKKDELVAALNAADSEDMNSADFKDRVNAASSMEELEEAENFYVDSGQSYSSVEKAIEKKRAELEEENS